MALRTVVRYGTTSDVPNDKFDLAFIDYRFGPSQQQESVDRAVRWAMHLYQNGKAFIILMSVEMQARVQQELFRRDSKLTRGLFEFVDKEEIKDSGKLSNRLNSFCAGFDTRHDIHQFAVAAEAAVDEAAAALKDSLHALGLEDFAYLEQISLQEDGHPLGDYMLWLFGEYFAHKLSVSPSLQSARNLVNGLKYERFLPLQRPPSVILAKMYSSAITEPVHEGWNPHPRDVQEATAGANTQPVPAPEPTSLPEGTASVTSETAQIPADAAMAPTNTPAPSEIGAQAPPSPSAGASPVAAENPAAATVQATDGIVPEAQADAVPSTKGMPLYQLGDLLIADKHKPAFLILNAGCDLQFSPGKRDCDPQRTILLVPGRFEPLYERGDEKNVKRTELFELGEERFRIIWQHTHVRGMPCYQVRPEHEGNGYKRKWRLKLPYALEVQQHFASQLTRVGVPTPTPLFRERPVEVNGKTANGDCCHLRTIENGMIVFHHRERDQFVLTVDCVHEVLDSMDKFIVAVANELKPAPGAPALSDDEAKIAGRRKKYLNDLRESRASLARTCVFQDTLHDLPPLNGMVNQIEEFSKTDKRVRLDIKHAATLTGRFLGNAPIVLAFSLPDIPAVPPGEAEPLPAPLACHAPGATTE